LAISLFIAWYFSGAAASITASDCTYIDLQLVSAHICSFDGQK